MTDADRDRDGVDDELQYHLDARTDALVAAGLDRFDARAQALREFGDVDDARAYMARLDRRTRSRHHRSLTLTGLLQDLRLALRRLRSAPAFTAAATVTLALGVGANAAVFSVVNAVLLRPLPFPDADQLYAVYTANRSANLTRAWVSAVDLDDWRAARGNIADLGGYWYAEGSSGLDLTGRGEPRRLSGVFVTPGFFSSLGVAPVDGRLPREDEMVRGGADQVAVVSYGFWQGELGGAPVAGETLTLGGAPFAVLGVMPADFRFPVDGVDVFVPFSTIPDDAIPRLRQVRVLNVVARARDGVDQSAVEAEMALITARLAEQYPVNQAWDGATVVPLHEVVVGPARAGLLVLLGAVGLVLLMACVNVAALQLGRAERRGREIAVRQALGAGRGRLVRQLLTESLMLAGLAGGLGLALGWLGLEALLALGAAQLPRASEVRLDLTVVLFALAVTTAAGLLFGLVPALRLAWAEPQATLRAGGRSQAGGGSHRWRAGLVIVEVAVAMVLVVGAGLTSRSLQALMRVDPGFEADGLLAVTFTVDTNRHAGGDGGETPGFGSAWVLYYYRTIEAVRALPGVVAAAAVKDAPFHGNGERFGFLVPGRPVPAGEDPPSATAVHISDGYFATLGAPMIDGREFTPDDRAGSPWVVVVNEAFARRFFPGERAVGHRLLLGGELDAEIVGVVGDIRQVAMATPAEPTLYVDNLQNSRVKTTIVARTVGDPALLARPIRDAIWQLDPNQTITDTFTFDHAVSVALARPRLIAVLLASFGILGLVLGAVGVYGVLAALVGERRREIGVRLALGASPGRVGGMVVRRGLGLTAIGVALGLAAAIGLGSSLEAVLYGIEPADPATLTLVTLVLAAAAAAASWLPARRAARLDPVETLRVE